MATGFGGECSSSSAGAQGCDRPCVARNSSAPPRGCCSFGLLCLDADRPGHWAVRFNGDSTVYDPRFGDHPVGDVTTDPVPADDCAQSALLAVGAYSAVVLSLES